VRGQLRILLIEGDEMRAQRGWAVVGVAVALSLAVNVIVWSLYDRARGALESVLDQRLLAMGLATARLLPGELGRGRATVDATLLELSREQRLEAVSVLAADLTVIADARGARAPGRANLLKLDADRLQAAQQGGPGSVGWGYSLEGLRFQSGYFPIRGQAGAVLVVEAGQEWSQGAVSAVRTSYLAAATGATGLGLLAAIALWWTLRSLEQARLRHGRAERLAAVGQMAAMVAHEVRNPLGSIRAGVELLREQIPEQIPGARETTGELLEEVDRIGAVTDEFLALARGAPLRIGPCDVGELLREIVESVRRQPAAQHASIALTLGEQSLEVLADRERLRRVFQNLLLNAAQVGGDGVRITVDARSCEGGVEVRVVDDGPGIPPALQGRLFEPFVSGRPGGSGLGLALSRRILEQHGGSLRHVPGAGRGTTFRVVVPGEPPTGGGAGA
jgi:signal transduction histidine kinase